LVEAIGRARLSVDMAAYSLNLWSIRDALIGAHRRGVTVRIVMESDNMDVSEVQDLIGAGIPVVGDQHEGLMHDKFVILDREEVWTGSMNYTVSGVYKDNNDLLWIRSGQLARVYTDEFEKMFSQHHFGPEKYILPTRISLDLDELPVEVYFSPQDGAESRLLDLIRAARESIRFLAFSFTSNDLGEAIIEKARSGVVVTGVMDSSQVKADEGTEYDLFRQAGLDVRLDGNQKGLMHHKLILTDEAIVVTGSFNFTNSAETRNDENMLVLSSRELAARYLQEFSKVFDQAKP